MLAYIVGTWDKLQRTFASAVSFDRGETELTDNLCEALEDETDGGRAGSTVTSSQKPGSFVAVQTAARPASPAPTSA